MFGAIFDVLFAALDAKRKREKVTAAELLERAGKRRRDQDEERRKREGGSP